jgi:hypothetical protein
VSFGSPTEKANKVPAPNQIRLNLGGEGEEPDVINQQPEWVPSPVHWHAAGSHIAALVAAGQPFLFCRNGEPPFPDGAIDYVFSNNVPIDIHTWLGPGVQSSEVYRVLRSAGEWQVDGIVIYTKP